MQYNTTDAREGLTFKLVVFETEARQKTKEIKLVVYHFG